MDIETFINSAWWFQLIFALGLIPIIIIGAIVLIAICSFLFDRQERVLNLKNYQWQIEYLTSEIKHRQEMLKELKNEIYQLQDERAKL